MPLLTYHAVDGAEKNRALGGRWVLPQVLQHQRPVGEYVDELPKVEDAHLLEVLTLLVRGGRAVGYHDNSWVIKEKESRGERYNKGKSKNTGEK